MLAECSKNECLLLRLGSSLAHGQFPKHLQKILWLACKGRRKGTIEEMNRRDERERVDSVLVRSATNRHELTGVHQLQDCEVCLLADWGEGDVGEAWRHSWAVQPQQEMLQVLSL